MPGDARKRRKVSKVFGGFRVCTTKVEGRPWPAFQNPWNTYLGDCSVVDEYLNDKPVFSAWFAAHYLNVFLRAVGQPAFVNNPILGAVIFASLFVNEWQVGIGCLLGGSIATLTELVPNSQCLIDKDKTIQ